MLLEIAVNCWNYQHRFNWMLSSILQQKGDIPDILINVSHALNNGNPTTEEVCDFFRKKGLNIKETVLEEKQIFNRSLARNIQISETKADWLLFADCDMTYDPLFFDVLQKRINEEFSNETKVIGADRVSLEIDFCSDYFDKDTREYPCVVDNVIDVVKEWPVWYTRGRRIAAGYFQLANVSAIKEKGSVYSGRHRDGLRLYRADRGFRCHMGGRTGMKRTRPQYHLNHRRDNSEKQR